MSSMVNEQAEGGVELTGLRIYRWFNSISNFVVPANKALFIFRITTTKHNKQDEIKHPPLVIDFEMESLCYPFGLALQVISMTEFFSWESALQLAQQVTDYIIGCISFHALKCCDHCCWGFYRCKTFSLRRPRYIFVADVALDGDHIKEPQGLDTPPFMFSLPSRSYPSSGSTTVTRKFRIAHVDLTECFADDVENIQGSNSVDSILRSWIKDGPHGFIIHSNPKPPPISKAPMYTATENLASRDKKHKLNEHRQSHVQKELCFDWYRVKTTLEFIDQVSENVDDNDCPICFRSLSEKAPTVKMVCCKHEFHSRCIFRWLTIKQSCPYCRTSSLFSVYL